MLFALCSVPMLKFIDEVKIENKKILMRVDFNVSLNADGSIKNDERIKRAVPTIKKLLADGNSLILITHLGRPKGYDETLTTERLAVRLSEHLGQPVTFVPFDKTFDPASLQVPSSTVDGGPSSIIILDNIRFHEGEKHNDLEFAKKLASMAEIFVNDAFAVCHRPDASVVSIPSQLPHYGGLLLKQEIIMIHKAIKNPEHPIVAIIGGSKISTKIGLIQKLTDLADHVLVGGGLVNNFYKVLGYEIGKSLHEDEFVGEAKRLLERDKGNHEIVLPVDQRVGSKEDVVSEPVVKSVKNIGIDDQCLDIGPETEKLYAGYIADAKTIIWDGPMGYFENPKFAGGTLAVYRAITKNEPCHSVIGGGETISLVKKQPDNDKITHISTGGEAMLEFIEKGTLPGIEALN